MKTNNYFLGEYQFNLIRVFGPDYSNFYTTVALYFVFKNGVIQFEKCSDVDISYYDLHENKIPLKMQNLTEGYLHSSTLLEYEDSKINENRVLQELLYNKGQNHMNLNYAQKRTFIYKYQSCLIKVVAQGYKLNKSSDELREWESFKLLNTYLDE